MRCFMLEQQKKSSLERMLKTFKPSQAWWCIPIIPSLKCLSRKIEFKVSLGCARNICLIKRNNLNHSSLSRVLLGSFNCLYKLFLLNTSSDWKLMSFTRCPSSTEWQNDRQYWLFWIELRGKEAMQEKKIIGELRKGRDIYGRKWGGRTITHEYILWAQSYTTMMYTLIA